MESLDTNGASPSHASHPFTAPHLAGIRVRLRPILPKDYGFLQTVELMSDLHFRFRLRGATPSPEQWSQTLWHSVLAQFLVVTQAQDRIIGLVMAYRPNFQDGHAHVGAARFGTDTRSPLMMLGFGLFVQYVFTCWNFRKLYLETPEFNYEQFASGSGRYFEVEARLREHFFFDGRYWDQLTLAIYRDRWTHYAQRLLAAEAPDHTRRVRVTVPPLRSQQRRIVTDDRQ